MWHIVGLLPSLGKRCVEIRNSTKKRIADKSPTGPSQNFTTCIIVPPLHHLTMAICPCSMTFLILLNL